MVKTAHQMGSAMMTTPAPGILLLRVPASSDPDAFKHFEGQINRALASRPRVVVIDLSEAQSVSTIMLGQLLKLRRQAAAVDCEVRLAGVQPLVRRVLDICRLDQLFTVFSSPHAAMEVGEAATAM